MRPPAALLAILALAVGMPAGPGSLHRGVLVSRASWSSCPVNTAPCTLHSVHYALHLNLQRPMNLNIYTSYYTLNTVHCTPHFYTTSWKFITSQCKHPKLAWVGLKIYIAKLLGGGQNWRNFLQGLDSTVVIHCRSEKFHFLAAQGLILYSFIPICIIT